MSQIAPTPTTDGLLEGPYLEDRWEDQMNIEQEMLAQGRNRMQSRIKKAHEKKDMTRLRPYRSLLKEFIEPVAENLEKWIELASSRRGTKPIALARLKQVPPETSALVALRAILRMLGVERRLVLGMALEIGTWIEHEAQAALWMQEDEDSWKAMTHIFKTRGSNAAHMRRSRVTIFNKHVAERIGYQAWTEEERRRVGLQMIDCVVQGTGRFRIVKGQQKPRGFSANKTWPMELQADPEIITWLGNAMDDELVFWPAYLPTVIKPKPWDGPKDGGYWTPFARSPFLIRFKAQHEEQRQRAIDEYTALDMPLVYEALNYIQDTGWAINGRVLEVAQTVWEKDLAIAGFPRREAEKVEPKPDAEDEAALKEWREDASETNTRNAKRVSRCLAAQRTLNTAERMSQEPEFWFPHMLDFRSRMYPIVSDLSPQGNDLHRGLLRFSEGKPVGERGGAWLAIHLANQFGLDKESFEYRVAWVAERRDMWLSIAKDPMSDRRWAEADGGDAAWQALAAAIEYAGYLNEGPGYISHLPIRVDGTCNGLQHLSAMVRDHVGGTSVNLVDGDNPRDIYMEVAEELMAMLIDLRGELYADMWLALFNGKVPREVTKRPVMILPYGGTRQAYREYTKEWLDKVDPKHRAIPKEHRYPALGFLVGLMWTAVERKLSKAREVMKWLQQCSKIASQSGRPIYWKTPAGFVVRHFYGEREQKKIETRIDGQRIQLTNWEHQPTLDTKAAARGIAPNFVHSMDASALMSCATLMKREGVRSMTVIHDAYGTLAGDMETLTRCIRHAFIETYREPVLELFLGACIEVGGPDMPWPALPNMGSLNIEEVAEASYFFA